jgi:hypothetical protein
MAMADLDQLIASVALMLENRPPPTENALRKLVDAQAAMLAANAELTGAGHPTSEELATAVRTIMTRFSIRTPGNKGHACRLSTPLRAA